MDEGEHVEGSSMGLRLLSTVTPLIPSGTMSPLRMPQEEEHQGRVSGTVCRNTVN